MQFGGLFQHRAGQRLLDHHEIELVQPAEDIDVLQGIVAICVHHQRQIVAEGAAHGADQFDVGASRDLDLDAFVSRCQMPFRGAEQLRSVFVQANCEAGFDAVARTAQKLVQGDTAPLRIDVPEGGFDADAGEVLPGQFVSRG